VIILHHHHQLVKRQSQEIIRDLLKEGNQEIVNLPCITEIDQVVRV